MSNESRSDERVVEAFDYELGQLHGLPGVTSTRQATVRHVGLTETSTFIIQTFRKRETAEEGDRQPPAKDTIFLEYIGPRGKSLRLVIPSGVAEVIARQRDQLATINRRRGAQQALATRAERGQQVGNPEALRRARGRRKKGGAK